MYGPGGVPTQAAARFGDEVALMAATRTMAFHELDDESERSGDVTSVGTGPAPRVAAIESVGGSDPQPADHRPRSGRLVVDADGSSEALGCGVGEVHGLRNA